MLPSGARETSEPAYSPAATPVVTQAPLYSGAVDWTAGKIAASLGIFLFAGLAGGVMTLMVMT